MESLRIIYVHILTHDILYAGKLALIILYIIVL